MRLINRRIESALLLVHFYIKENQPRLIGGIDRSIHMSLFDLCAFMRRGVLMSLIACEQLVVFLIILLTLAWPLGKWILKVSQGQLLTLLIKVEKPILEIAGSSSEDQMTWYQYAFALLTFNTLGVIVLYLIQRYQSFLPLNPVSMTDASPDLSFNTAISFVTNTDWQSYVGESTMSYLTQMLGLTVQNFFSAATGIAVVFALFRGFTSKSSKVLGNFWVDITRITLWILLPISVIFAIFLNSQGVIQNFESYKEVKTLEINKYQNPKLDKDGQPIKDDKGNVVTEDAQTESQTIAMGPVASQEAIKMIGTNGGGFFNANSAHPYENPTPLTNFLQIITIFLIPAALCFAFGV